jgi:hypothetical protein
MGWLFVRNLVCCHSIIRFVKTTVFLVIMSCLTLEEFFEKLRIGQFLFLFSVSDFLVFEMILLQIPKLEFVSNVSKFGFSKFSTQTKNSHWFLKKSKLKTKTGLSKQGLNNAISILNCYCYFLF